MMSELAELTTSGVTPPQPRTFRSANWIGMWTLYRKEVQRFLKVGTQTVLAPIVTTLLFLAVFALALKSADARVDGIPFVSFIAPGLIMMAIAQNAFANTSSSVMISKVQGNIVDVLMPPLSPLELLIAFAAGGVTRGVIVGLATGLAMWVFVPLSIASVVVVAYYAFAASLMLALLGLIGGLWSEKFDHLAALTNFVITPLAFLSGTFYSVEHLPGIFYTISHINPFFFMIDGFRAGFIGRSDAPLAVGAAVLAAIDLVLAVGCYLLLKSGWRLKA